MARKKSMREIYAQADRILKQIPERNARFSRVLEITNRYSDNAAKRYGVIGQYDTPVPRRVYMGLSNG